MTLLPRYHYERYQDTATGDTQQATWYIQRVQWLVFDRHSVGCMCSVGTEREAARIVFALNLLDGKKDAQQFEEIPWRDARLDREAIVRLVAHA